MKRWERMSATALFLVGIGGAFGAWKIGFGSFQSPGPGFFPFWLATLLTITCLVFFFTEPWCRFDLSKLVDYRLLAEAGESSRCYVYLCAFDWPAGVHFIDCVDVCGLVTHRRALLLEISNAFGSLWNNRSVPFFHGARDSFTKRIFDMMQEYVYA